MRSLRRELLVACIVLLLTVPVLAIPVHADLPSPPAPGTTSGPLSGASSYTGGILVVPKPQDPIVKDVNKPMGTITCEAVSILYSFGKMKSELGVSVQGPISDSQTQGIVDAIDAYRPPKTVDLGTYVMEGSPTEVRTWTWKSVTYTHTHYEIWANRQSVPAVNELIGYINVETPKTANVVMDSTPCPAAATPGSSVTPQPAPSPINSFFDVFFQLPADGFPPFISYGTVKIMSQSGIAAAGLIRPGETVSFLLPPGSYSAEADISILGIHFSANSGTYTSPPGATAVLLSVTVLVVEEIVYILTIIVLAVAVLLLYGLFRWYRGYSQNNWFSSHVVASRKYFETEMVPLSLGGGTSRPGVEVHMMIPHRGPVFQDPGYALRVAEAVLGEYDGNGNPGGEDLSREIKVGLVQTYSPSSFKGSTEALLWQLDGKVSPRGYRLDWDAVGISNDAKHRSGARLVGVQETPSWRNAGSLIDSIRRTEENFVNDIDNDTPVWWQLKQVFNTMYVSLPGHGKIRRSRSGGYHVETGRETTPDIRRALGDDRGRVYFSELLHKGVGTAGCITFKWKAVARRTINRKGKRGWSRWSFVKPIGWEEDITLDQLLAKPWVSMPQPTRARQYAEWARGKAA